MKTALITGITGQDRSYLAELLLEKGYEVHGIVRRSSLINTHRIDHIYDNPNLTLHYGDLTDATNIIGNKIARLLGPNVCPALPLPVHDLYHASRYITNGHIHLVLR